MTQDEIIELYKKANDEIIELYKKANGWSPAGYLNTLEELERFAAIVAEPWIETNKALAKEIIELKKQPVKQEPASNKYNHKRIGWELERTAMGDSYYGNALYSAMDLHFLNKREKDCLHRYMHGGETPNDRFVLQDIAMKVYSEPEATPVEPVRTKDLTDDEIRAMFNGYVAPEILLMFRAVIAADREKNNANNNT